MVSGWPHGAQGCPPAIAHPRWPRESRVMPELSKLLPPDLARKYIAESLLSAGRFAALLLGRNLLKLSAILPDRLLTGEENLTAFDAGKRWPQRECDRSLEDYTAALFPGQWWAMFENAWSKQGDLPQDEDLGDHIFFEDEYLHVARAPRTLDLPRWRNNAVGHLKLIYLLSTDVLLHVPRVGEALPKEVAGELARSVIAIAVSAYDDESWVCATVAS